MKTEAAGNTEVPAYLALIARGYEVSRVCRQGLDDDWVAKKGESSFMANSPVELLGVVTMIEVRGANWLATDQEIDEFLKKFSLA